MIWSRPDSSPRLTLEEALRLMLNRFSRHRDEEEAGKVIHSYAKKHAARLFTLWRVRNADIESDCAASELMVRLLTSLAGYDPSRPAIPYVYRVLRNICIEVVRHQCLRKTCDECDIADDRFDPALEAAANEQQAFIRLEVHALPAVNAEALLDQYFDGLSLKEAAVLRGVSAGTVNRRRYVGREDLKAKLRRFAGDLWEE